MFFDLPEPPWSLHANRCIQYLVRQLRNVDQISAARVREIVEDYAHQHGVPVPRAVSKQLLAAENRESGKSTIITISPNGAAISTRGRVVSVDAVSFIKRFASRGGAIGRALFASYLREAFVEVCIRGERDAQTGFVDQFTIYLPRKAWEAVGAKRGERVDLELADLALPTGQPVWMAHHVTRVRSKA